MPRHRRHRSRSAFSPMSLPLDPFRQLMQQPGFMPLLFGLMQRNFPNLHGPLSQFGAAPSPSGNPMGGVQGAGDPADYPTGIVNAGQPPHTNTVGGMGGVQGVPPDESGINPIAFLSQLLLRKSFPQGPLRPFDPWNPQS